MRTGTGGAGQVGACRVGAKIDISLCGVVGGEWRVSSSSNCGELESF